jgi:hypothetical protein
MVMGDPPCASRNRDSFSASSSSVAVRRSENETAQSAKTAVTLLSVEEGSVLSIIAKSLFG